MHTQRLSQPIAFTSAAPTGAWFADLRHGVRGIVQRLLAAAAPRPITTWYIGEAMRAAQANREVDWRFHRRASLNSTLISHSALHVD